MYRGGRSHSSVLEPEGGEGVERVGPVERVHWGRKGEDDTETSRG